MDNIEVKCKCGRTLQVPPQYAGKQIRCNVCQETILVPQGPASPQNAYVPPDPAAPAPGSAPTQAAPKKTAGLAIAAFILGLCGLITFGVAGIVGIILGIVALAKISRNRELEGQGFAIAGIAVGAFSLILMAVLIAIAIPAIMFASSIANEVSAIGGLKQIMSAEAMYEMRYQSYGTLYNLGASGSLTDASLASGRKWDYDFRINILDYGFEAIAEPKDPLRMKTFSIDHSGIVKVKRPGEREFVPYDRF